LVAIALILTLFFGIVLETVQITKVTFPEGEQWIIAWYFGNRWGGGKIDFCRQSSGLRDSEQASHKAMRLSASACLSGIAGLICYGRRAHENWRSPSPCGKAGKIFWGYWQHHWSRK
jgi:hypothetical protein